MKRLLVVVMAVGCAGQLMARAKSAADFFIEFDTMEERHKKDWFEHMKSLHNKKIQLLETHVHDWVGMRNKHLKQAKQKMSDCSKEAKDKEIARNLDDAISIHKKHKEQWKNWSDSTYNDAKRIAERHDKELANFEQKYRKEYKEDMAEMEEER